MDNLKELIALGYPGKSKSSAEPRPILGHDRPDLVPANVLCSRCSRFINKSKLIRLLLSGDMEQIQREFTVNFNGLHTSTTEVFFYSRSVRDILSLSSPGCHICSIISTSHEIGPDNLDREDPQKGVIQACVKFDPHDMDYKTDEERLYLFIEDVSWLRIPEKAAQDAELLDDLLRKELCRSYNRSAITIDRLQIVPLQDKDFMYLQSGPPETEFLPSSTNSFQTFQVIRRWLDDCLQNHSECNQNFFTKGKPSAHVKLPTRLIFLGDEASGQLAPRLILPHLFEKPATPIKYLTLSHSWAITGKSTMLTITNLERFLKGIALEDLSQTFRDALIITRELGFQYIWIDSLCIIQDSDEDWEKEALTMSDVYGHSSCNISACGALGIDACFASRNPLHHFPCRIRPHSQEPGGNGGPDSGYVLKVEWPPSVRLIDRDETPLLSRGWCVQERLLSPRVVYFGAEEVFWECCHHVVKESSPPKRLVGDMVNKRAPWASQKARFQELCNPEYSAGDIKPRSWARELSLVPLDKVKTVELSILRLYQCWYRIVSDYSFASLTRTTDRLMAFAGIVSAIEKSRGWTYVAGTWKEFWPLDLLWCFTADQECRMTSGIHAPSWSWAAKEGGKSFLISVKYDWHSFDTSTVTYMSQVMDYFCPPTLSQHCSGVITDDGEPGMTITLKGPVSRGVVGNDLGTLLPPFERPVQLYNQYGLADSVKVRWDEVPAEGEPVLLLLVVTWEDHIHMPRKSTFQHVGLVLMPEPNQPVTDGTSGMLYKRVGAWIAPGAKNDMDPQSLFFNGTEAEETVRIC